MMSDKEKSESGTEPGGETPPELSPEAKRALAEAEARRRAAQPRTAPTEVNGPRGPEPTRYGDWEKKGIASDF